MEITAALVKELRERSGAGMMECKKALTENGGDIEVAMEFLRKQGLAKADKKAGRVAAEGRISTAASTDGKSVLLLETNCETDFVAKDTNFVAFTEEAAKAALAAGKDDVEAIKGLGLNGETIETARQALVAKIGENIQLRRAALVSGAGVVGSYVHSSKIGVAVSLEGGTAELARGLAMHVAAMNPPYVSPADVPAEIVAKEKEIALAQMTEKDRQKPAEIQEKMISGKINKTLAEMSLTGQPYVIDSNQTVEQVLKAAGAKVLGFTRIAVGEGIEKKEEDFHAEVMKQAGLA